MADFKDLIEYLRLQRRTDEASKNADEQFNITLNYLENSDVACIVAKEELLANDSIYIKLFSVINTHNAEYIYLWDNGAERKYLIKTGVNSYLNLADSAIVSSLEEELHEFPIEEGLEENYFFYTEEGRVIYTSQLLNEVIFFGDTINFGPQEEYIKNISSGKYEYDFNTHRTWLGDVLNVLRNGNQTYSEDDVKVTKFSSPGLIELIPIMEADVSHQTFTLCYIYHQKGFRPSYGIDNEDCAIKLEFGSIGGLLSFLNETLFSQGFNFSDWGHLAARDIFRRNFKQQILDVLERKVESIKGGYYGLDYLDVMEILHYLPPSVALEISTKILWMLLNAVINKGTLNNRSEMAEENIFIKLLEVLLKRENDKESEAQQKEFIRFLAGKTLKDELRLEYLHNNLHGENNSRFVRMVNSAWRKSFFVDPDEEKNPLFESTDGPLALPYQSKENWLGFYVTNAEASFETKGGNERLVKIKFDTGKTQPELSMSRTATKEAPIYDIYYYHPFHPVFLKDIEQQETEVKLDAIVPAFMLLANHDKQFWHNVITGVEYALDVVTTLSGIGNIAKFRYLARVAARTKTLQLVSRAGRAIASAKAGVALTAGVIEITSGTVNILLKLTGAKKTAYGSALSEYLMWLELLSLAGELTVAIEEGLRKSARELLEHEEALRKTAKNADGTKEIDEIIAEFRAVAGMAENLDINLKISVKEFENGLKKLSRIKPEEAVKYLDEALIYFNHHVVDGKIVQISDKNCVNVVQAVDRFLSTGKVIQAAPSNPQNYFLLTEVYKKSFLTVKIETLESIQYMKEGERGILLCMRSGGKLNHVLNVVKIDGQLMFKDGQVFIQEYAAKRYLLREYELFKYLKTN